jgi:hypothetical protein
VLYPCRRNTCLLALPAPCSPTVAARHLVAALVLDGGHAAGRALAAVAGQVLEAHRLQTKKQYNNVTVDWTGQEPKNSMRNSAAGRLACHQLLRNSACVY